MSKNRSIQIQVLIISIIAIAYLSWQLLGLRFTNSDDILFHLYSKVLSGAYLSFSEGTALSQNRLQAYVNMPILLWADGFQNSIWFDVINLAALFFLYISIIYYFSQFLGRRDALILVPVIFITFPLHYYYTIPQGYPVMGVWGLAFAFISAGIFGSCLGDSVK